MLTQYISNNIFLRMILDFFDILRTIFGKLFFTQLIKIKSCKILYQGKV